MKQKSLMEFLDDNLPVCHNFDLTTHAICNIYPSPYLVNIHNDNGDIDGDLIVLAKWDALNTKGRKVYMFINTNMETINVEIHDNGMVLTAVCPYFLTWDDIRKAHYNILEILNQGVV